MKEDAIVNKLKEEKTIDCLNEYIASKFKDKELIGLSLKNRSHLLMDHDGAKHKSNKAKKDLLNLQT